MKPATRTARWDDTNPSAVDARWNSLYLAGAVAALMVVAVGLLDVLITLVPQQGVTPDPGKGSALDWFTLLQGNGFVGVRGLGLFNVFNLVLGVLVLLALYGAHQKVDKAYAVLALILSCVGLAVYAANNPALPMLNLSGKYTAATTEAQRAAIAATGEALLARGEDFTPGAVWGFLLGEAGSLIMAGVMLRGAIFSKAAAYIGLAAMGIMIVFTLWATFVPIFYAGAMVLALIGGLLSMGWYVLIARRLFQLRRDNL